MSLARPHWKGVVDCALYRAGARRSDAGDTGLAELYATACADPDAFVWLGLHEPDAATLAEVADIFDLHPLTVEDVLDGAARPKLNSYGEVSFLVLRAAQYVAHRTITESSEIVETGIVRVFIGQHFALTVRHGAVGELRSVRADLEAKPDLLALGSWAVAYAVCDRIVDTYVDITAAIRTDLNEAEAAVFRSDPDMRIEQVYQLKRELLEFNDAVLPLQQPLAQILNGQYTTLVPHELRRYFRDIADHQNFVATQVANYGNLVDSILQARLTQVTISQNDDMRKIAAWAAIAALQTAIAGIYGMNFRDMPELRWRYGYPAVLAFMALCGVLLYRRLRRAGWL